MLYIQVVLAKALPFKQVVTVCLLLVVLSLLGQGALLDGHKHALVTQGITMVTAVNSGCKFPLFSPKCVRRLSRERAASASACAPTPRTTAALWPYQLTPVHIITDLCCESHAEPFPCVNSCCSVLVFTQWILFLGLVATLHKLSGQGFVYLGALHGASLGLLCLAPHLMMEQQKPKTQAKAKAA